MLDIIVVGAGGGVLFFLGRRLLQRMAVARRQSTRIAADGEIAEGGISYGGWDVGMVLFLFATTLPLWVASVFVGGNGPVAVPFHFRLLSCRLSVDLWNRLSKGWLLRWGWSRAAQICIASGGRRGRALEP